MRYEGGKKPDKYQGKETIDESGGLLQSIYK